MSEQPWNFVTKEGARFSLRSLIYAFIALLAIFALATLTKSLLASQVTLNVGGPQAHYLEPLDKEKFPKEEIIAWFEFGKNLGLLSPFVPNDKVSVTLSNFSTAARPWARDVPWYIKADNRGRIDISFPLVNRVTQVAVFMTDGDSHWRSSRIYSGKQKVLAERLHLGKWYFFPVNDEERKAGQKQLRLEQLTGSNIAVSALILLSPSSKAPNNSESETRE